MATSRSPSAIPARPARTRSRRRCLAAARHSADRTRTSQEGFIAIKNVGVIGCGLMGSGIVQVAAQAGFDVLFVEADDALVTRGLERLRQTLEGLVAKGKLEAKAKDETLGRMAGTTRLEELKAVDRG